MSIPSTIPALLGCIVSLPLRHIYTLALIVFASYSVMLFCKRIFKDYARGTIFKFQPLTVWAIPIERRFQINYVLINTHSPCIHRTHNSSWSELRVCEITILLISNLGDGRLIWTVLSQIDIWSKWNMKKKVKLFPSRGTIHAR